MFHNFKNPVYLIASETSGNLSPSPSNINALDVLTISIISSLKIRQLFPGPLELRIGLCIKSWIRQIQKGYVRTSLYASVIEESLKNRS